MRQSRIHYLQLRPGTPLPQLNFQEPFRVVVVAEIEVHDDWQYEVSCWLLDNGCLYAICWGIDCNGWEECFDHASITFEERNQTDGDHFLMTTSHAGQSLEDAFWYAENCAFEEHLDLNDVLILQISEQSGEDRLKRIFSSQIIP